MCPRQLRSLHLSPNLSNAFGVCVCVFACKYWLLAFYSFVEFLKTTKWFMRMLMGFLCCLLASKQNAHHRCARVCVCESVKMHFNECPHPEANGGWWWQQWWQWNKQVLFSSPNDYIFTTRLFFLHFKFYLFWNAFQKSVRAHVIGHCLSKKNCLQQQRHRDRER